MRSFRIALAAFLLVGAMAVSAVTTTNVVVFNLADFTSQPATNRKVVIKPLSAPVGDTNTIFSLDWRTFTSDSSGMFSVSNMTPGLYSIELQSPPTLTKFTIGVSSTNETVYASTLLTTATNQTWPPSGTAYTVAASDARYSPIGAGGLAFVPQVGSQSLTNWSMLDTNALTLTSNDVVTALGYAPGTGSGSGITNGQADINFVNLSLTNGGDSAAILVVAQEGPDQVWKWTPNELLAFHGVDRMINISSSGDIDMLGDLTASHLFGGEYAGNGTNLTNLNASALASGTVPLARLSGITSNQLDAATAAQLALAGSGGNSTTNAADLTTGTLSLARLPGEVLSNSVPFFTVAAAGIANGLSTRSNNGAMFGPDTPGTVTCGLQEALNAVPKATNQGPLAFGGRIILQPGHFYFTNTLLFSNVWNNGLTLEGAGLFQTKLVYAGTGQGVKTVNLCGTPASLAAGYPLAGHYEIRNIGFTALNNTTNYLLWITNQSYVNINNCLFTSWQLMDNDLWGSGVSITAAQTNDSALVGLHLGGNGDHASWITDCFFQGLATGADLMCDHAYIKGFKTAEIGFNKMCWPATSKYSLGAAILRTGGLDSYYEQVHFYGCKSGLMIISPSSNEHMYPFLDETCDYLFGCDTLRPDVIKWHDSFLSEAMPCQYKIETAPAFNLISLNSNSEGFIIPETFNGSYRGKLFSVPKPDTNTIYLKGFVGLTDFDDLPISTAGLTNSPYIWSSGLHSFTNRAGYGIAEIEIFGTPAYYLTNAAYPGPPGVNYVIASVPKESAILRPYQQFTNDSFTTWDDEGSGTPTLALAFYGTNWGEVDATVFLNNAASLTNLNASELRSGTVALDRLPSIPIASITSPGSVLTNGASFAVTFSNAVTVVGTNYVTKLRVGTLTEGAQDIRSAGNIYSGGSVSAVGITGSSYVSGGTLSGTALTVSGIITGTNGFKVSSNSWLNVPTLVAGQNFYCSSNGVPHVIWSDEAGTLYTNRLVP